MTVPTADGLDVVFTAAGLIVLLAYTLYVSWRRWDDDRRDERMWRRGMR